MLRMRDELCPWNDGVFRLETDGSGVTATVQLGEQIATVTAEQVKLPDGRAVPIPVACKMLELRATRVGMAVFMDGVAVP